MTCVFIFKQQFCKPAPSTPYLTQVAASSRWKVVGDKYSVRSSCLLCARFVSALFESPLVVLCRSLLSDIHVLGTGIESARRLWFELKVATRACQETTPPQKTLSPASKKCISGLWLHLFCLMCPSPVFRRSCHSFSHRQFWGPWKP